MKYKVKVEGVTPYMQHRMDDISLDQWEKFRGHIIERPDINKEDNKIAEFHSYINVKTNQFFIPSEHFRGSLIGAGKYHKSKVGAVTKSMTGIVAAMFLVSPHEISLPPFKEVDKRSAVNAKIHGRVIVVRPIWNTWDAEFILDTGEDSFTDIQITELIKTAGKYVGIGSYRPTCNGQYGRYKLVSLTKNAVEY